MVRVLGKGSKERVVPVGRTARAALDDVPRATAGPSSTAGPRAPRADGDAVFLNARGGRLSRQGVLEDRARRAGDRVGLGGRLSPHVLRHSCATHMLDHGADIRVVQELLGHASLSTTQVYTKVSPERLRAVYERGPSRGRRECRAEPGRPDRGPVAAVDFGAMAETTNPPARAQLHEERDRLTTSSRELGRRHGRQLDFDEGFADSGQVTAERGEVEALAGTLRETLAGDRGRAREVRRRHLRPVRGLRRADRRGPPRGDAGGPAVHHLRVEAPLSSTVAS